MVFSSLSFLFLFLPMTYLLARITKGRLQNYILLAASLLFYAWGEPYYIFLMLGSAVINYGLAFLLQKRSKWALVLSVVINLGILGYFKYAGFVVEIFNKLWGTGFVPPQILLPIGISFYTFQVMSYLFDVYKGDCPVQKNFSDLLLYITFFPQLIAGPIVKYHDIDTQIRSHQMTMEGLQIGLRRFVIGLGKKVILANQMALVVDGIYSQAQWGFGSAWLASVSYVLQIYFDFSAYSDMAIGLGKMFGFTFLENFDYPLTSVSIGDFWRRWHMSLSTWFKEYVYIPLGGNRKGTLRRDFNLFIVFFCTGLWHGASWNFIVWGLWQYLFIVLERRFFHPQTWPKFWQHFYTLIITCCGFVFFRAETLAQAWQILGQMFRPWLQTGESWLSVQTVLTPWFFLCFLLAVLIGGNLIQPRLNQTVLAKPNINMIFVSILWIFSVMALTASTYNPFIYFRF